MTSLFGPSAAVVDALEARIRHLEQEQARTNDALAATEARLQGAEGLLEEFRLRLEDLVGALGRNERSHAELAGRTDRHDASLDQLRVATARLDEQVRFDAGESLKRTTALLQRIELRDPAR